MTGRPEPALPPVTAETVIILQAELILQFQEDIASLEADIASLEAENAELRSGGDYDDINADPPDEGVACADMTAELLERLLSALGYPVRPGVLAAIQPPELAALVRHVQGDD